MFEPGSYVICKNAYSIYYNTVLEVRSYDEASGTIQAINEKEKDDPWHCIVTLYSSDDPCEIARDDPDFPENLAEQSVYHEGSEFFHKGDLVLVQHPHYPPFTARVRCSQLSNWERESSLVQVICLENIRDNYIGKRLRFRWDFLTLILEADDTRDYITGEPLGEYRVPLCGSEHNDLLGWINDMPYDNVCICSHCNNAYFSTWMESVNGEFICQECVSNLYSVCDECGRLHLTEHGVTEAQGAWFCQDCARQLGIIDSHIHRYWYKPHPIFHPYPEQSDTLYLGVELEIDKGEDRDECLAEMEKLSDGEKLMYFKRDGSLTQSGIEIVTHPCTLDFHQHYFPWKQILGIARAYDYKSHDAGTCGLHVHVNRTALGKDQEEQDNTISRIVMIFDRFWPQFVNFSRRKSESLSQYAFAPMAEISAEDSAEIAKLKSKKMCTEHYCSVNLSNENTVEFRIFRGTMRYDTLMAALELVSNVISFAKKHTLQEIDTSDWMDLLNEKEYQELMSYASIRLLTKHCIPEAAKPNRIEGLRTENDDMMPF